MSTSLVAKSGETRKVHHVACLLACASAIVPYLVQLQSNMRHCHTRVTRHRCQRRNICMHCQKKVSLKVMAKMGISTVQSYAAD
ncbi:glutamate synthase central domain-containing protein [Staphylococcus aureus]